MRLRDGVYAQDAGQSRGDRRKNDRETTWVQ
jgi:hypothetical protein